MTRFTLLALSALLAAPWPLAAAETDPVLGLRQNDPRFIAFTGATVVVSPGHRVEDATLVLRDGRVVGVTAGAPAPEGARVIALDGRIVYPGFFDPYTDYGLAHVGDLNPEPEGDGPHYRGDRVGADSWNDAVHAERHWVESFRPDDKAAETLLERGVTVVESAKLDGVFRGRGFVTLVGEGEANELVLVPEGHDFASFDKGSSHQEYPSSLMGSIALVRQTLLDAAWYRRAWSAHAANPHQDRPEVNRALAALAETLEGHRSLVFETDDLLTLLRAGRISRELGVPMIQLGSNREYERIGEVAALGQEIFLPASFPETPDVGSYEAALDVSLAELRHWERAPSNAAVLAEEGVTFALTGHGLRDDENFLANVRSMVERGLAAERALAALTTVPARLLGVEEETGTLEAGKLANLVIADGDLLSGEGKILSVWVAGREAKSLEPLEEREWTGSWSLVLAGHDVVLTLDKTAGKLEGTLAAGDESFELEGIAVAGREVTFRVDLGALELPGVTRISLLAVAGGVTATAALPDGRIERLALEPAPAPEVVIEEAEIAGDGTALEPEAEPGQGGTEPTALVSRLTRPDIAFGFETLPQPETVLVRNATVWTASDVGILEGADLLVTNGKIVGVGRDLEVPAGARVIDGRGLHVTPGIIDEHSHLAISRGVNEGSHAVTAEVRIGDVVNPDDIGIYRALAGGVTIAQLLHGSANPIGGQAQVVKLRWGASAEEMKFAAAPPTIKFALGENVKQSNWGEKYRSRYPQSRMGVETLIRDAFLAAREYRAEWEAWRALRPAVRRRTVPPRRDLQLEALVEVLEGRRFVHSHSYVQSEVLMLMRLAEELGFRIQTFTHILEGYKVAPEMAAHGAGASTFADWWAYKFEVYDAIPYNTCLMHDAGVVVSINSDSDELMRRLNQEAGKSVLYCDMPPEEAIKLATLNPAIQLEIDRRVGSLEVGKDADFVLWNGNPLSVYSRVEQTWVDGRLYFSRERDAALRERDAAERRALVQKVLTAGKASDGGASDDGDDEGRGTIRRGDKRHWECDDVDDVWQRAGR